VQAWRKQDSSGALSYIKKATWQDIVPQICSLTHDHIMVEED
jgi:hypothetical protein